MKKIMFNDKYGLTTAVLKGRKTQTRRVITTPRTFRGQDVNGYYIYRNTQGDIIDVWMKDYDDSPIDEGQILPMFKFGEVVAVAQNYKDAHIDFIQCDLRQKHNHIWGHTCNMRGWNNKMFVQPSLMPHQIRITGIRVERLQDISEEDCLKEGIIKKYHSPAAMNFYYVPNVEVKSPKDVYTTPHEAYAELIDKVSGKGTWESNPYVFVYDFELVR